MQHASMCTGHETGTVWSGDSMEERVNMCAAVALTVQPTPCNSKWRLECFRSTDWYPSPCHIPMHTLLVMHGICLYVRVGATPSSAWAWHLSHSDGNHMHMYYVHMCGLGTHRPDSKLQLPMDAGMLPVS